VTATTPTHVDSSIPEIWATNVLRRHLAEGFWGRFVGGEGSGAPIIQKSELLNKPGDLIHIQVTDPLSGAGVEGDTAVLEGNEENLATSEIKCATLLRRHAVRVNRRANKKSIIDLQAETEMRLAEWGRDKMDDIRFARFIASVLPAPLAAEAYTPNKYIVAAADGADGGAVAGDTVDDVTANDTLSVRSLQVVKLRLTNALAKPLMVDGFPHYVVVTSPYATFQLKQESRYESWVREAHNRGTDNPFFRGAIAVIDGMIVYEHPNVTRTNNATSIKVADGLAFGKEAFIEALDENVSSKTETFDYGKEWGISYEFAMEARRALELSSLQFKVAAQDV
jgi:N4-gp56 family major capsid protein